MQRSRSNSASSTSSSSSSASKRARHSDANQQQPDPSTFPPYFRRLDQLHRSLNTLYTFLSSRKNVPPLLSTFQASIKDLRIEDAAAMKCLVSDTIRFEYVDELELSLYADQVVKERLGRDTGNDIFNITENDGDADGGRKKYALIFEFVETMKKSTADGGVKSRELKGPDAIRMPTFSTATMTKLITKRNNRFTTVLAKYLNSCVEKAVDPELEFKDRLKRYIPVEPAPERQDHERRLQTSIPEYVPSKRDPIPTIVSQLTADEGYCGQLVDEGCRVLPAQKAEFGTLNFSISQQLADALYTSSRITSFFTHQADALNALHDHKNVIVATATSSGKSLIYQVPVLTALESDHRATAIYIFPTKALAQDQKRALQSILSLIPNLSDVVAETFDGDTPKEERVRIRESASVLFTNPDMLHVTILPSAVNSPSWREFFRALRFVVVDELHVYDGVFGSNVAFVMRRLRRICAFLGNESVQFISCSATIGNPANHMAKVFGISQDSVTVISNDGSPAGEKHFLSWNTPFKVPEDKSSGRRSEINEAARLFVQLVLRGVRTIAFCKVRTQCEMMMKAVRQVLESLSRSEMCDRVASYRGGYTAAERRRIEKDMFESRLLGIIATNALELGVDIGSLDAVIILGFPFSIANLRQQSGRAGRRNQDSLTLLVGGSSPVDQHYMIHPSELFDKPNAEVVLDIDNQLLLESHLQCAAFEIPISISEDEQYFGPRIAELASTRLKKREKLKESDPELYDCHPRFLPWPAKDVAIRDIEDEVYAVVDITNGRNVVVEEIEASRITFTIYEGAIYIHQGKPYIVRDFNADERIAKIERTFVDWTTSQRDYTDVDAIETHAIKPISSTATTTTTQIFDPTPATTITHSQQVNYAFYGNVKVTSIVFGYFKVDSHNRIIDAVDVSTTPPVEKYTKGFWIDVPRRAQEIIHAKQLHLAGAIHAAEHIIIGMSSASVVVMATQNDLHAECKAPEKEFSTRDTQRKRPARLTFYDAHSAVKSWRANQHSTLSGSEINGTGLSRKVFEFIEDVIAMAIERMESCGCDFGCPECIVTTNCAESNAVLSKVGAIVILKEMLRPGSVDPATVPEGPEGNLPPGSNRIETIAPVTETVALAKDLEILGAREISRDPADLFTVKVEEEEPRKIESGSHDQPFVIT
ncbi:DEAD/DEAH box helicase [Myxozyma melibiosi]|uniref:DEAD/DEAH box helicase n=1 Tax=Myxozyma melibiosi TaxID=54550 RepID=A0ABR1FFL9_9ASCO